jgi:hypothetical protein
VKKHSNNNNNNNKSQVSDPGGFLFNMIWQKSAPQLLVLRAELGLGCAATLGKALGFDTTCWDTPLSCGLIPRPSSFVLLVMY